MSLINSREPVVKRIEWVELFGRISITAAGYPIEYVKLLIQLGHEPIPPRASHTLFGRPALALPGVWTYMKHIKKTDGFFGLYRGLAPKLCTNLVQGFTYTLVLDRLPQMGEGSDESETDEDLTDQQKILRFIHGVIQRTIAKCAAVFVSYPLRVITVRSIAQFVGKEKIYEGLYSSVKEIYNHDGILGYYKGIVPKLIGDVLVLWVADSLAFALNTYVIEEKAIQGYVKTCATYVANSLFYPFGVVSTCMSVNNCGLAAGQPPCMPIYDSWGDCWSHLSAIGQLKRGSSILWRYYQGPMLRSYQRSLRSY